MAGQGAKGGGQVAMPAAQAMGGYRGPMGPMGPQGALGGPPLGGQPKSAEMIAADMGAGGLGVATGPIDTGLNAALGGPSVDNTNLANVPTMGGPNSMLTEAAIVGQRPRITDAMGNPPHSQMFGMQERMAGIPLEMGNIKSDIYQGPPLNQGPNALTAMLPPTAGSQVGPRIPQIMPDVYKSSDLSITSPQQGSGPILLPSSGPNVTMRPNPNLPNQGLPMPSGGLKGGIFGQQPRPMPQPSQAQYAPLAPQGQFNVNQAAAGALQQAMGATQQGLGFTPMGIRPTAYRPSQIAGTSLAPYTNPYESQVVQQTMRDIGTAQEQALNLQGAQAQRAGAFGGSRQGIAEAETRLGYGQQALDAASRLRQQGYQTALGLAGQDVGAQTAAAQYAAQQRASAQAQNLAAQQAAMGMRLNAAQQLAGLGQQAFGTGQAIQQQQMQQGLLQQMLQQSLIDAAKAQYAGYTGAPSAALGAPLAALGASPVPQTTTQTKQPGLFDYLRLGATAYGM